MNKLQATEFFCLCQINGKWCCDGTRTDTGHGRKCPFASVYVNIIGDS